jgi:hypothetical protein
MGKPDKPDKPSGKKRKVAFDVDDGKGDAAAAAEPG